jgi:NADH-quinone oxidoreductase subunit J
MTLGFSLLAILTVGSAITVMTLRNLVHSALALTLTFLGLAGLYLQLGAQFVGFAQVLVYIGAVAILIVFAILLTRGIEPSAKSIVADGWLTGLGVAFVVFVVVSGMIASSPLLRSPKPVAPEATVRQIGDILMQKYVLPLEVIGLLLTVALIGAVLIAKTEKGAE